MDKIYSNSEIIKAVLEGILSDVDKKRMEESSIFISKWKKIITSIKSVVNPDCGKAMYSHSQVIDIKDGTLILQVDHPGFIQLFENHKKYIFRGLEMNLPQMKIKNISYLLDKKNDYNTQRDMTREEMRAAIEKQSPKEDKIFENPEEKKDSPVQKEFPPELEAIFSRMRKSILTNDKKI